MMKANNDQNDDELIKKMRECAELRQEIKDLRQFQQNAALMIRRQAQSPGKYTSEEVREQLRRWGWKPNILRDGGEESNDESSS